MARARHTKLGDWINDQLKSHPDGFTVAALTALARSRHSHQTTSVDVVNALNDLAALDYATPGPWCRTNGQPATGSNTGACVRYWYAKEHAPA